MKDIAELGTMSAAKRAARTLVSPHIGWSVRQFVLLAALSTGCGEPAQEAGDVPARDSALLTRDAIVPQAPDSASKLAPFAERVVVFLQATPEEIEAARGTYSEEDFAVVADDLMWYRATAYEYLEQRKVPLRRFDGRTTLEFIVQGAVRRYDFADITWLDVLVLYEPNREPRVISTNEVHAVEEYFPDLRVTSGQ